MSLFITVITKPAKPGTITADNTHISIDVSITVDLDCYLAASDHFIPPLMWCIKKKKKSC